MQSVFTFPIIAQMTRSPWHRRVRITNGGAGLETRRCDLDHSSLTGHYHIHIDMDMHIYIYIYILVLALSNTWIGLCASRSEVGLVRVLRSQLLIRESERQRMREKERERERKRETDKQKD